MGFEIGQLSSVLASGSVGQQVDVGVLKALQNLEANVAAELFASLGLGQSVDTRA